MGPGRRRVVAQWPRARPGGGSAGRSRTSGRTRSGGACACTFACLCLAFPPRTSPPPSDIPHLTNLPPSPPTKNTLQNRLNRVTEVHGRRFLLRNCALEVYFSDAHEVFLAFPTPKDRGACVGLLRLFWVWLCANPRSLFAAAPPCRRVCEHRLNSTHTPTPQQPPSSPSSPGSTCPCSPPRSCCAPPRSYGSPASRSCGAGGRCPTSSTSCGSTLSRGGPTTTSTSTPSSPGCSRTTSPPRSTSPTPRCV